MTKERKMEKFYEAVVYETDLRPVGIPTSRRNGIVGSRIMFWKIKFQKFDLRMNKTNRRKDDEP